VKKEKTNLKAKARGSENWRRKKKRRWISLFSSLLEKLFRFVILFDFDYDFFGGK